MSCKCLKLNKINLCDLLSIENWINKQCNCSECVKINQIYKEKISKYIIKRYPKSVCNNLSLTSKMIIKIQLEIAKVKLLEDTS
jgi:hypothetical protein